MVGLVDKVWFEARFVHGLGGLVDKGWSGRIFVISGNNSYFCMIYNHAKNGIIYYAYNKLIINYLRSDSDAGFMWYSEGYRLLPEQDGRHP